MTCSTQERFNYPYVYKLDEGDCKRRAIRDSTLTHERDNEQAFLEETSLDSSKDDPEFDLAGICYVFKLLCMGTMPWSNRVRVRL